MNSSKILRRAKHENNRNNMSDFQFLLSSMEREKERDNKENHQDNTLKLNSFKNTTINLHPPVRPFFHDQTNNHNHNS